MSKQLTECIALVAIMILPVHMSNASFISQSVDGSVATRAPYCISKVKSDSPSLIIDESGIPIVDYGCINGKYIGLQRNPVTISDRALQYYDYYKTSQNYRTLHIFLNNADWLLNNAEAHGNYSIFVYRFPWPNYSIQPPWRSDMANGKALEVLAKAGNITGDKKYLDSAKKLLNAFFIEVRNGGLTYKTLHDGWWYEQYASDTGNETRVLNGFMFALLNIYEYYISTHDPDAKFLFDQGIIALKKNLPEYDYKGEYSYYDDAHPRSLSPLSYHKVVVQQLKDLYNITRDAVFKKYHDSWQNFKLPNNMS